MKMVDLQCPVCKTSKIDHLQRDYECLPKCCDAVMNRVHLPTGRGTVIQDSIEGGTLIHNGLCNADGTPRRYYSKSEIAAEGKRRGLVNAVTHIGTKGGDRNRHTSRWT